VTFFARQGERLLVRLGAVVRTFCVVAEIRVYKVFAISKSGKTRSQAVFARVSGIRPRIAKVSPQEFNAARPRRSDVKAISVATSTGSNRVTR